jgi:hypothetical protein
MKQIGDGHAMSSRGAIRTTSMGLRQWGQRMCMAAAFLREKDYGLIIAVRGGGCKGKQVGFSRGSQNCGPANRG